MMLHPTSAPLKYPTRGVQAHLFYGDESGFALFEGRSDILLMFLTRSWISEIPGCNKMLHPGICLSEARFNLSREQSVPRF